LDLKTINNGKSLVGQFYSNDDSIIKDEFIIEKSSPDTTFVRNTPNDNPSGLNEIAYKNK
jgi:hypothetical protein